MSPGLADSNPSVPRISTCASPSSVQPSRAANSPSFISEAPFIKTHHSTTLQRGSEIGTGESSRSLAEKTGLNCRHRLAPRNPNDAEDRHLRKRGSRNENPQCCPVKIRRRNLNATVEQRKQVVGDHAFDTIVVAKFQPYPQTLKLRSR